MMYSVVLYGCDYDLRWVLAMVLGLKHAVIYYDEPWTLAVDCVAYLRKLWRVYSDFLLCSSSPVETCCCGWNNRAAI